MDIQKFLESQENEHIVLVHEESTIGHDSELNFIKEGLESAQVCLYITNDILSTKSHMKKVGIDVTNFEERKLLHILEIPKTFSEYEKIILDLVNGIKKYGEKIRLVSTHNFDFTSNNNIDSMIEIEQKIDDAFSNILGTMICSFSINKMSQNHSKEFITKLLDSHHKVVFLQKNGTPKWFNLP